MEITTELLYAEFLIPSITFLLGVLVGWILRSLIQHTNLKADINLTVQVIIVILWSLSVIRGLVDVEYSTPMELNVFMGVVLGAMNEKIGKFLIELWRQKK